MFRANTSSLSHPLALPNLEQLPAREALADFPAVALFLQRAQAVRPDFQLTAANARDVAEICVRLDGLPLALELAAARLKLLSPQELLARLSHRLEVLTGGPLDLPMRQQTLRNTILWSYQLLDAREQRLFRRLSVFAGGCTLEAAEAVCAALDGEEGAGHILERVTSLLDKSLLQTVQQEGKESRLVMLETIREYGLEALVTSGEIEASRQAHANYYLELAEEAERELEGLQAAVALEQLEREHDNLRAVMRWSLERGEMGHSIEMALRLGGALWRFWDVRGHWSEGRNFLEWALAGSKEVAVPVQVKALRTAASLAFSQGDMDRTEALYEESLARCRELGDTGGIALSLRRLGDIACSRGNLGVASSLTEEALALFREVGHKEGIAQSHVCLAEMLFFSQGDPARAHTLLEEGLALSRELGHKAGIAWSLALSGRLALSQSDAASARCLIEESLVLYREMGDRWGIARSLFALGRVAESLGDYAAARALYEESLSIRSVVGDNRDIAFCLEGLAGLFVAQGEPVRAVRLWGAADGLRKAMGTPIPPVYRADYERSVAAARAQLGEKAFAAAWAEGRTMTPEQALTLLP